MDRTRPWRGKEHRASGDPSLVNALRGAHPRRVQLGGLVAAGPTTPAAASRGTALRAAQAQRAGRAGHHSAVTQRTVLPAQRPTGQIDQHPGVHQRPVLVNERRGWDRLRGTRNRPGIGDGRGFGKGHTPPATADDGGAIFDNGTITVLSGHSGGVLGSAVGTAGGEVMPGDTEQATARIGIAHNGLLATEAQHSDRNGGVGATAGTRDRRVGSPVPRVQRPGGLAGLAAAPDADQTGQGAPP